MHKLNEKLQKAGLTQEEVALCFYNKIKPYILDFLPTLNSLICEAMLNTNSEKMTSDTDCYIDGKKYTVKTTSIISPEND